MRDPIPERGSRFPNSDMPIKTDPRSSNTAHQNSDLDTGTKAQHHTLGHNPNQSSPGDHNHDGSQSLPISAASLVELASSWPSYTPTWTASTTNPVLGNGILVGQYLQLGKLVFFRIQLNMGSTTTFGTGTYHFSLPVPPTTAAAPPTQLLDGLVTLAGVNKLAIGFISKGTMDIPFVRIEGGVTLTGASGWAATDQVILQGFYEAA